jgi:hypothetical protein
MHLLLMDAKVKKNTKETYISSVFFFTFVSTFFAKWFWLLPALNR